MPIRFFTASLCVQLVGIAVLLAPPRSVSANREGPAPFECELESDFDRSINALFRRPRFGNRDRVLMVLRFLPSFHPQVQIVIRYDRESTVSVEYRTLQRPLQDTLRVNAVPLDLKTIQRVAGLSRAEITVDSTQGKKWLTGFFESFGKDAARLGTRTFRGELTGETYVQLDGTRYLVELETNRDRLSLDTMGPEINTQTNANTEDLRAVDWMNEVRQQVARIAKP